MAKRSKAHVGATSTTAKADDNTGTSLADLDSFLWGIEEMVKTIDEADTGNAGSLSKTINSFMPVIYREIARAREVLEELESRKGGAQ